MNRSLINQYIFNIALSLDQFINALLLGDPDDSISGRCGRAIKSGRPRIFVKPLAKCIDFIFLKLFNDVNHCYTSIEPEENMTYELWKWSKND
jgi:hypothetical protein